MARASFLDIEFDNSTQAEVENWLDKRTAESAFAYVVTPNVDHIVRMARDPSRIRRIYRNADLCVCDSRVLATLASVSGIEISVVPGSDLVEALFKRVLKRSDRVCVVGGSLNDAEMLAEKFPGVEIIHHEPPMGLGTNVEARTAAVAFAAATKARFTLLAVGSPQQELLAWELKQSETARGTALCIGASVDFLVGKQKRAPKFVQRARAEWAWRLGTQPRRLARRYLIDGPEIFVLFWRWARARRTREK